MALSGKKETQEFPFQRDSGRIVPREYVLPGRPGSGNQPGLGSGIFHPAVRSLFTKKDAKSRATDVDYGLPLQQRRLQSFSEGLTGVEAENPVAAGGLQKRPGRGFRFEREDMRSIFVRDPRSRISRAVVYDDDLITGPQRLQSAAQAQSVIFRVQNCCDRGHGSQTTYKSVRECSFWGE